MVQRNENTNKDLGKKRVLAAGKWMWKSMLCQGNGCVFSRANPGTPAQAGNATNKLCMWCDPDKLKQSQEKPGGRSSINQSLTAFARKSPDVHQQALQLLPADWVAYSHTCTKANCIFSRKNPGYPARARGRKALFCMWRDEERLKDAETTVMGQKHIAQSLSAFLDEPRVAAAAWAKLFCSIPGGWQRSARPRGSSAE